MADPPPCSIVGWRGQTIVGSRSQGSKEFWAHDWRDMVVEATGEITTKATAAGKARSWFSTDDFAALTKRDGYASYLQSLRSEDTVTWAAFGALVDNRVIGSVLDLAFGQAARPAAWTRRFWPRFKHPDTGSPRGPEPDLVLDAPGWRYVIEAKWLAPIDDGQGSDRKTSQLTMRAGIAREIADANRRGVLVIVHGPSRYVLSSKPPFTRFFEPDGDGYRALPAAQALEARAITWEQVTDAIEHVHGGAEIVAYLRWRLDLLPVGA